MSADYSRSLQPHYSTLFLGSGLIAGSAVASTVGSVGLVGVWGGVGIGALPIITAGGILGGASYGIWQAIQNDQLQVLGISGGLGAVTGLGVSSLIGNFGIAIGGTAFAVGPTGMAIAGGVLGLGTYGIYQAVRGANLSPAEKLQADFAIYQRMSQRLSEQILEQELLAAAMAELHPIWQEKELQEKFTDWEIEGELAAIKAALYNKKIGYCSTTTKDDYTNQKYTDQKSTDQKSTSQRKEQSNRSYLNNLNNPVCSSTIHNSSQNTSEKLHKSVANQQKLTSFFAWGRLILPNVNTSAITENSLQSAEREQYETYETFDNWHCVKNLPLHNSKINATLLRHDSVIITASSDRTVSLYNLNQQKHIFTCFGYSQPVTSLALSHDGNTLYTADDRPQVTVWDLAQQKIKKTFSTIPNSGNIITYNHKHIHHHQAITKIALNPTSDILATASKDKTIHLWYANSGQLKRTLLGHQEQVLALAFSPDGQTLVSGSADQTIRLWSVNTWQSPVIMHGHTGWVTAIALSPDGEILVSGSTDYTIKLWDVRKQTLIHRLISHTAPVRHLSISPDGKILASSSDDGTVKIWQLNTGKLCHTMKGTIPIVSQYKDYFLLTVNNHNSLQMWQPTAKGEENSADNILIDNINNLNDIDNLNNLVNLVNGGKWWQILKVNQQADTHTVKLAYRRLARQYHPDVNQSPEAIAQMQIINQAYQEFLQSILA